MIYRLLALCLSFLFVFTSLPANAEKHPAFLAVYSSIEFPEEDWDIYHPDLLMHTTSWNEFDAFLDLIKKQAHGKDIVLDLQVHGDNILAIYEGNKNKNYSYSMVTFGYVINHIEKHLKGEKLIVIFESCFGAGAYKNTMRHNTKESVEYPGVIIENCDHIPAFPVYGMNEKYANLNNLMYMEYIHEVRLFMCDLREYEFKKTLEPRDMDPSSPGNQAILTLWIVLKSYSI